MRLNLQCSSQSFRRHGYVFASTLLFSGLLFAQKTATTAYFPVDTKGVISRSDIVLLRPNLDKTEAMPLGNGRLGLAVWSEEGYTAQLNREDTWPFRLSPGHLVIPGLQKLTSAGDYSGRLDLYNGEFQEKGGGLNATTYVDEKNDVMVVQVTGADPGKVQEVDLRLWPGRKPIAETKADAGVLAETWQDTEEMGASGLTYGSLAAIRVDGRDTRTVTNGPFSIKVSFRPKADGSFRVLVACPEWRGGDAIGTATALLAHAMTVSVDEHRAWWNRFWQSAAMIKLSSPDHSAEYFENLRAIDLYATAAENRDRFPGNQAGIGDLFSSFGDEHHWGPSAYWHWNLRMQVSANFGAGLASYNEPYFNLYNDNMDAVAKWTRDHMGGRRGICVPETMRFNGPGYENERWLKSPGINCTEDGRPYYNARTISTGAEIGLWVWQQYKYTDDKSFLESHYPLMRDAARFLLAYARRDEGGKLYTYPSNAHESNWDARSPTTDVAAMQAFFPVVIEAAAVLGIEHEDDVIQSLRAAVKQLPPLPLRLMDSTKVLRSFDFGNPHAVIANSYTDDPIRHNEENIGLEPVWPYGLIGDDGALHDLGVRTFMDRPNKAAADWSADAVQAARLGLADDMKSALAKVTETYQLYPSGFAQLTSNPEFYVEQIGVVADAVQSALVQDYDGIVRVAPAIPKDWDAEATVVIEHSNRVHLRIRKGEIEGLGVEGITSADVKIRNPWVGQKVRIDSSEGGAASKEIDVPVFTLHIRAGESVLIFNQSREGSHGFDEMSGRSADVPKFLGTRSIGLGKSATTLVH